VSGRSGLATRALSVPAIYSVLVPAALGLLNIGIDDPDAHAAFLIGLGLITIWCVLGGALMFALRKRFARWATCLPIDWMVRFALLFAPMALIEEAMITPLTNAGPALGAVSGAVRITSSTNHLELVSRSAVAFVPWFIS
jgi:hypothetical protein